MSDVSKLSTMFTPKRNERLDNVIEKLKDHIGFVPNSDEDDEIINFKTLKVEKTEDTTNVSSVIPSGDGCLKNSYLMWQNSGNVCWLDASMALLAHNRTLIQSIDESSATQVANIIHHYYKAISILNDFSDSKHIDDRVKDAKDLLKTVQESALKYLQPILKYKEGEPDSAFCSLLNLIVEDKSVKDLFDLEYTWVQVCQECKTRRAKKHRKPIVTLPRVEDFQPSSPVSLYQCLGCKASDQKMVLNFRTLPQCLLFHFENGAGKGELQCCSFKVDERTYKMTGVMTHEKGRESNSNHFVTFIRDPASDMWMECNDLCEDIMGFSVVPPFINLQDVYILMFEAMDGIGTVASCSTDTYGQGEELACESVDIPFIDLEEEAEEDKPKTVKEEVREFDESKDMFGKVDLSGKDWEEASNKDAGEKASLNSNNRDDVSCENATSLVKDLVNVSSSKSNFEGVSLFETVCGNDSAKDQLKSVGLFNTGYEEDCIEDKLKTKGLFGKFHSTSRDKSSQDFSEVCLGSSTGAAVVNATVSGCVGTIPSEAKDALLDEITSTDAIVGNSTTNSLPQLHINTTEHNSIQSVCRKSSIAYVSLDKDISSSKNNVESLAEVAHSPKDIQPDADSVLCTTGSSKGAKKKLVEKEKLVSHKKTLLGSEKTTNETSENVLVPERNGSHTSDIKLNKINNAAHTSTESKSKMSVATQSKTEQFVKNRKHKLESISKVENNFAEINDNLQDHTINTPCIKSKTNESILQDLDVIKKKEIRDQPVEKELNTSSYQPKKQVIEKQQKAKKSFKNMKYKSVNSSKVENNFTEINDNLQDHTINTPCIKSKPSESILQDLDVIKKKEIWDQPMGKNLNISRYRPKKEVIDKQRKAKKSFKNVKYKSVNSSIIEDNSTKTDIDLKEQSIVISNVKAVIENAQKIENLDATEEQLKIQIDYPSNNLSASIQISDVKSLSQDFNENENFKNANQNEQPQKEELISSNDPLNIPLIAKENKAKSLLQNNNCKLLNHLKDEKIYVALQEKAIDNTPTKTTNESLNLVQTLDGKKKLRRVAQSKMNYPSSDLNLSNDLPDISLFAKQKKGEPVLKKRKCMDSFKSEVSTEMDSVLQEDNLSNIHLDKSSKDVTPKKIKYQLRNKKPAVQQQNGIDLEKTMNETSDCNDKHLSSDITDLKADEQFSSNDDSIKEPLHGPSCLCSSNDDRNKEPLHGPSCLCNGTKMTENLIDMVIGNVLQGMFSFIEIKEKK